jgi:hypothetical protein
MRLHHHLLMVMALALLTGCAASPRLGKVIPESGPLLRAVATGASRDDAEDSAHYTAEHACRTRRAPYQFLDLRTEYQGLLDEETSKALERITDVARSNGAGPLPTLSSDEDYRSTVWFKCMD